MTTQTITSIPSAVKPPLTAERLRELMHYSPETGLFTWLIAPSPRVKVGDIAGSINSNGYVLIFINRKSYKAHRLAVLWVTGFWPVDNVDHVNCNGHDNRWSNLRMATQMQNTHNALLRKDNTTGMKGVSFHKASKKFIAYIKVNKKQVYLGRFDTKEKAAAAYATAANFYFGEFARTG